MKYQVWWCISELMIPTRCLSLRYPWRTYMSMHPLWRAIRPSIIVTIMVSDPSLEKYHPLRRGTRPLKWYFLFSLLFLLNWHNTCHNHISEQCIWHVHTNNEDMTIFITLNNSQQHNHDKHQQWFNKLFKPFSILNTSHTNI